MRAFARSTAPNERNIDEILIHKILPRKFPETGGPIGYEFLPDNKILIWYFNYANGKLNPRIPKPAVVSKTVKIDEKLGTFIGLILTEGLQSRRGECRNKFILMNCDFDVIKFCHDFLLVKLGIPQDFCVLRLYHPLIMGSTLIQKAKTRIKNEFRPYAPMNISSYPQANLKNPKIALFIYNTIFRLIVDRLIKESLEFIKHNERFRVGFLRGVFAAEGSVELRKGTHSLHFVNFSQCNDKIRSIIKKTLTLCGIGFAERIRSRSKDLRISHLKNFERIRALNICSLSRTKAKKFKIGLDTLKMSPLAGSMPYQTKKEILRTLKEEKKPITITQLAMRLNKSYYTIWDHICRTPTAMNKRCGLYFKGNLKFTWKNKKEKLWGSVSGTNFLGGRRWKICDRRPVLQNRRLPLARGC